MRRLGPFLLAWFLPVIACIGSAGAQQSPHQIIIEVTQRVVDESARVVPHGTFLTGYRRSLSGQVLEYRSPHPDAETALLVRARTEVHSITWETDTIPESFPGEQYHFIWLAGLERGGFQNKNEAHSFDLFINGEHWFTFKNVKDSTAMKWSVPGNDGGELSFEATMVDRVGDLFGYMTLKVPKKKFKSGMPLVLHVEGEDAGSSDWFMVFQYSFHLVPRLRVEPVLLKKAQGVSQALRVSLDNLQGGRTIDVRVPDREVIEKPLGIGANVLFVPIDAVQKDEQLPVLFSINGALVSSSVVNVTPVAKREIYLLSYSHNDIGYTDLQPNIEHKQWRNLDEALRLIKETRDYPVEARYKWNMEVLWSLESYLAHASEERRQEVVEAIRSGSIGLNALFANILTGLANSVEMNHFTEFARELSVKYSAPITTALVSDIPGFTWGIVPALAQSGVKYFSISPNPFDRIGYTLETWGDKPFHWVSQSGQEKVLTWVAGASYASFHEGDLSRLGDEKLMRLLRKLDDNGYPYEIVQLPYTVGGDNGPPDPDLPGFVKRWNERYVTPRLIIATHKQLFEEFEKRYGSTLPSFKGDFTPYWEDGAASTAYETALNRQAVDRLIQGEALWSMISPQSFPDTAYSAAWRKVAFYDEHTWGAWNSISEPDSPLVKGQWMIKRQFALDADSMSKALLAKALPSRVKELRGEVAVDIYNTQSWPRTDLVILTEEQSGIGDLVVDESRRRVPSQRLSTGELAVLAENVLPMSAKRLFVKVGNAYSGGAVKVSGSTLENKLLALAVNGRTGAIESLRWKKNNKEFVDLTHGKGLNHYSYVPGRNPADAQSLKNVVVKVKEKGSLLSSLLVQADAPGCRRYSYEVRVVDGIGRVDIINEIDKRAVRDKEGVHIAFPFDIPGGQLRYDVANGIVRPEHDQLPGACKNFFSVQSWVDVSSDSFGVTWATVDAPLIEIGAVTAELPWMKTIDPSSTFYSYVMNNYWHTNYKADQEGLVVFRYSVQAHEAFRPDVAARFGVEHRQPLIAVLADPTKPPVKSLLQVSSSSVLVSSLKAIEGGKALLLCLYNPMSSDQSVRLEWNKKISVAMYRSDPFARAGDRLSDQLEIPGWGSAYLRAERK